MNIADVVGQAQRAPGGPGYARLGQHHVHPEHNVLGVDWLAVRPLVVWLQRDGHLLAVVDGQVGQAERLVQVRLAALAEPVQRPVQQVLEVIDVVSGEFRQPVRPGHEGENVVRVRGRSQGVGGGAPVDRGGADRCSAGRGPAASHDDGKPGGQHPRTDRAPAAGTGTASTGTACAVITAGPAKLQRSAHRRNSSHSRTAVPLAPLSLRRSAVGRRLRSLDLRLRHSMA